MSKARQTVEERIKELKDENADLKKRIDNVISESVRQSQDERKFRHFIMHLSETLENCDDEDIKQTYAIMIDWQAINSWGHALNPHHRQA